MGKIAPFLSFGVKSRWFTSGELVPSLHFRAASRSSAAKQFQDKPFEIVFISLDEGWKDALKVLPSDTLPKDTVSLIDPTLKVADTYGSYQFPETYLLDGEQRIVTKWVGGQEWQSELIQSFLLKLIAGVEHSAPNKNDKK